MLGGRVLPTPRTGGAGPAVAGAGEPAAGEPGEPAGTLRNQDPTKKGLKKELKTWIRDRIPVRGCGIMWGKKLEGDGGGRRRQQRRAQEGEGDGLQGKNARREDHGEGRNENEHDPLEVGNGGNQQRVGEERQHGQQDHREETKEKGDKVSRLLPGTLPVGKLRNIDKIMSRKSVYKKFETDVAKGAAVGGPRGKRIQHYSRTLNRAPATGLRSSDDDAQTICFQIGIQAYSTGPDRGFSRREDFRVCGTRAGGGLRRPPPWPPPAAVCLIRM